MPLTRIKDLFRPAWKQSNPDVRQQAVRKMTANDYDTLRELILTDESPKVRLAATEKVTDPRRWEALLAEKPPQEVAQMLREKLKGHWRSEVMTVHKVEAASRLLDQIDDPELFAEVGVEAEAPEVRLLAIERIQDQHLLCRIAERPCGKEPGEAAVRKITDITLLQRLADAGANKRIRRLAADRLARIEELENQPSPDELRRHDMEKLLNEASRLAESWHWEFAANRIKAIEKEVEALLKPGEESYRETLHLAQQRFAERRQEFEERQAQERQEAAARQAMLERRESICTQIEALTAVLDATTDLREQTLAQQWEQLQDQLPEEVVKPLTERINQARAKLATAREALRQEERRLRHLEELVTEAEKLAAEARGDQAEAVFQECLRKTEGLTFNRCDPAPLKMRLTAAHERFRAAQQEYREAREKDRTERQAHAEAICQGMEEVFNDPNWRQAANRMKELHQQWRDIDIEGLEPAFVKGCADKIKDANNRFGKWLTQKREEEEWERWANLNLKEELVKQVEALAAEENPHKVAEAVKEAQAKWKTIGPIPRENGDELWHRFQTICNEQFARAKIYFDQLDRERAENLEKKEQLAARAEILQDSTDWKATADELKAIQDEWKSIGPGPREEEQQVYHRFRKVCDRFFERLREHHEALDQERQQHLEAKEKICTRAEELAESSDWWETINDISEMNSQWKQIGPSPHGKEEEIWTRFQAATQHFFDRLDEARPKHLEAKQALVEEARQAVTQAVDPGKDKHVGERLKELQARWKEIGPAPQQDERALWKEFQKICDDFFEVRREHFEEQIQDRDKKVEQKQQLIQRAREALEMEDKWEAAELLKSLQQEWKEIGAIPFREDAELWQEFRGICNTFFEARNQAFQQVREDRDANLRRKEELLERLERLAGKSSTEESQAKSSLSLADQLKLAFEENFIMAAEDPRDQRQTAFEEVKKIQAEWRDIGPVPRKVEQALWQRYREALDYFFDDRRGSR